MSSEKEKVSNDDLVNRQSPTNVYKRADQKTKDIVNGYLKSCQKLLPDPDANPYYFIPVIVNHLCLWFYRMKLRFKEYQAPIELSNDNKTVTLKQNKPAACFCNEWIDVDRYTKIAFKIDNIGYVKIGLTRTATTGNVYFANRLNSNGQVSHNGTLENEDEKMYKTGDIVTFIAVKKTMRMEINGRLLNKKWDNLDGKYRLGVGLQDENDRVSLHEVIALNEKDDDN